MWLAYTSDISFPIRGSACTSNMACVSMKPDDQRNYEVLEKEAPPPPPVELVDEPLAAVDGAVLRPVRHRDRPVDGQRQHLHHPPRLGAWRFYHTVTRLCVGNLQVCNPWGCRSQWRTSNRGRRYRRSIANAQRHTPACEILNPRFSAPAARRHARPAASGTRCRTARSAASPAAAPALRLPDVWRDL